MADAELPSSWASAGRSALGNSLWFLPFIALERFLEGHLGQAVGLGVVWLVAMAIAVKLHVLQDLIAIPERRHQLLTWAFIMVGATLLGAGIYRLASEQSTTAPPVVIHQPASPEDIAKATAPIQSELDAVVKQRDIVQAELNRLKSITSKPDLAPRVAELEAQNRELQNRQTPVTGGAIGPRLTLNMRERLGTKYPPRPGIGPVSPGTNPMDSRWALVITTPAENEPFAEFLHQLVRDSGIQVQRLPVPDHSINLDAPAFPAPGERGITLHGTNALNSRLLDIFPPCVIVRATAKTVDGLHDWYRERTKPEEVIVWIEIGNGSPWTMAPGCFS